MEARRWRTGGQNGQLIKGSKASASQVLFSITITKSLVSAKRVPTSGPPHELCQPSKYSYT